MTSVNHNLQVCVQPYIIHFYPHNPCSIHYLVFHKQKAVTSGYRSVAMSDQTMSQ